MKLDFKLFLSFLMLSLRLS